MGHFQQLRQITAGIRFKPGMKIQVVGMFDWDERTLHVELLAKTNTAGAPSLLEKKHRMGATSSRNSLV